MKSQIALKSKPVTSRYSPHGEYGLKSQIALKSKPVTRLLSTRRVWIEIASESTDDDYLEGYSPHGEYGLKYI